MAYINGGVAQIKAQCLVVTALSPSGTNIADNVALYAPTSDVVVLLPVDSNGNELS